MAEDRAHDPSRRPNFRTFEDSNWDVYQGEGPQRLRELPEKERDNYKWEKAAKDQLKND